MFLLCSRKKSVPDPINILASSLYTYTIIRLISSQLMSIHIKHSFFSFLTNMILYVFDCLLFRKFYNLFQESNINLIDFDFSLNLETTFREKKISPHKYSQEYSSNL